MMGVKFLSLIVTLLVIALSNNTSVVRATDVSSALAITASEESCVASYNLIIGIYERIEQIARDSSSQEELIQRLEADIQSDTAHEIERMMVAEDLKLLRANRISLKQYVESKLAAKMAILALRLDCNAVKF